MTKIALFGATYVDATSATQALLRPGRAYLDIVMAANQRLFAHLKEDGPTYYVDADGDRHEATIIIHEAFGMIEQTRSTAGADVFVDVCKPFPVPIDGGYFEARDDVYYVQRIVEEDETQYVVQVTK